MTKLLAAMLLLVACKDDRAPDPRMIGFGQTPVAAGEAYSCSKLVARSIADRYLAGFTLTERKLPNHATRCSYRSDGTGAFHSLVDLSFHCSDQMIAAMPAARSMMKNVEDVPGIGRGAIRIMGVVEFWDDDTNCMVTVAAMGNAAPKDTVALARELAASITPASLADE